jgi:hypothetical protein
MDLLKGLFWEQKRMNLALVDIFNIKHMRGQEKPVTNEIIPVYF